MPIIEAIRGFHDELTSWRRDIHAHPELGFEEQRTSDLVAGKLAEFGIEVHRGIGRTGVVGRLRVGNSPRAIGLRADMDACRSRRRTNSRIARSTQGRMHACGHDGHTTMLLGAARYLARDAAISTAPCISSSSRPKRASAAPRRWSTTGCSTNFPCDAIFGMHNRPGLAVGKFQIRAGADDGRRRVFRHRDHRQGRARRAARSRHRPGAGRQPHHDRAAVDRRAQRAAGRYRRRQRHADPRRRRLQRDPASAPCCAARCAAFSRDAMAMVEQRMRRIAEGVAAGFGATRRASISGYLFPPLVNHADEARFIAECAADIVGEDNVNRRGPLTMASEDFSYMLERVPGAYIQIGNGDGDGRLRGAQPRLRLQRRGAAARRRAVRPPGRKAARAPGAGRGGRRRA